MTHTHTKQGVANEDGAASPPTRTGSPSLSWPSSRGGEGPGRSAYPGTATGRPHYLGGQWPGIGSSAWRARAPADRRRHCGPDGIRARTWSGYLGIHAGLELVLVVAHAEDNVRGTLSQSDTLTQQQQDVQSAHWQESSQPTLAIRKVDPSGARSVASERCWRGSNGIKSSCKNLLSFSRFFCPSGSEHS